MINYYYIEINYEWRSYISMIKNVPHMLKYICNFFLILVFSAFNLFKDIVGNFKQSLNTI